MKLSIYMYYCWKLCIFYKIKIVMINSRYECFNKIFHQASIFFLHTLILTADTVGEAVWSTELRLEQCCNTQSPSRFRSYRHFLDWILLGIPTLELGFELSSRFLAPLESTDPEILARVSRWDVKEPPETLGVRRLWHLCLQLFCSRIYLRSAERRSGRWRHEIASPRS